MRDITARFWRVLEEVFAGALDVRVLAGVGVVVLTFLLGPFLAKLFERFWVGWELASLAATFFYCCFMFFEWFFGGSKLDDVLYGWANGISIFFALGGLGFIALAALFAWATPEGMGIFAQALVSGSGNPDNLVAWGSWMRAVVNPLLERKWLLWHGATLVLGTVCFLMVNLFIVFASRRERRDTVEVVDRRREALTAILFSDLPTLVAFSVLTVFFWRISDHGARYREFEAFLGGAVTFQLLAANVGFAGGQLRTVVVERGRRRENGNLVAEATTLEYRRVTMPLCGFNEVMLKGLTLFAQGLYEQLLKRMRSEGVTIEQALEREIHEMNVFLPALDAEYERLRQTMDVDEAMRALVKWTREVAVGSQ